MHKHHSALGLAKALRPVEPVTLVRPHAAARAARFFVEKFPGRSMYAVKANPSPELLQILWDNGITHYDVASIAEVTRRRFLRHNSEADRPLIEDGKARLIRRRQTFEDLGALDVDE